MNKPQLFLISLILILAISCKKDNEKVPQSESSKITNQLLTFKKNLTHKSGSSMMADSAVWYLEGLLNYENANNNHSFSNLTFNKDSMTCIVHRDSISINELSNLYNQLSIFIDSIKNSNQSSNVNLDIVDLQLADNNLKSESETLKIVVAFGEIGQTVNYVPFGINDNWYWGGRLGKCDGTCVGRDAATELQRKFLSLQTSPGYFTSVEGFKIFPWYYEEFNPYSGYYLYQSDVNYNPCLPYSELNYYLSKFDYIKNDRCPSGKVFKTVLVQDEISVGRSYLRIHTYEIYYGIKVESNN